MDCPVSWLPRELGVLEIPDTLEFGSLNVHTFPASERPSILFPLPGTTFPHHAVRIESLAVKNRSPLVPGASASTPHAASYPKPLPPRGGASSPPSPYQSDCPITQPI